jgi:dienelactone hydrolase
MSNSTIDSELVVEEKVPKTKVNTTPKNDEMIEAENVIVPEIIMTAREFGMRHGYTPAISEALIAMCPMYNDGNTADAWKRVFAAFMSKPENINWFEWLKKF